MLEKLDVLVTAPPYAPFLDEVARHPLVSGLRLNTVMPVKGPYADTLRRLRDFGKPLWVDLKARQLRVVGYAVPPFTEVFLSHRITVPTPCDAFFHDGKEHARVVAVDGNRLILEDGPRRVIGPGESVNVVHPQLQVEGLLTENDERWLDAMGELGERRVMLSFVESSADAAAVKTKLPEAEIVLKIESLAGVRFAEKDRARSGRLMAARGDLYVEVIRPHRVIGALRAIIKADPRAIVASRLFGSLSRGYVPEAADIGDAAFLWQLGYRSFMLGDEVCFRRDGVMGAINLLGEVAGEMG